MYCRCGNYEPRKTKNFANIVVVCKNCGRNEPAIYKNNESAICFDLMFYGCQTINAPQAMELLSAIKVGKIQGITFTGVNK